MRSEDEVLRAQARALLKVLRGYSFDRLPSQTSLRHWQAIQRYGSGCSRAPSLSAIHDQYESTFRDPARRVTALGLVGSAVFLALHHFTVREPVHRFLEPSRWIVSARYYLVGRRLVCRIERDVIFEKLELAFDQEIFASEPVIVP
jgi:hypothetical protein